MSSPENRTLPFTPDGGTQAQVGTPSVSAETLVRKDVPTIPGYEFVRRLGKGGMGTVWLARDLRANRLVALKLTISDELSDAERIRFRTEAQAMAKLQQPNIVRVYEVNEYEGRPFFTMDYCPGGSLSEFLDRKPQPAKVCAAILEQIALGVAHAHANGIIHRDLKPSNVLLGGEPTTKSEGSSGSSGRTAPLGPTGAPRELKLTDFGLAKNTDASTQLTKTAAMMGTPSYMAPEQATNSKVAGPLADQWSLGVILYEMLTGSLPFVGADWMEVLDNVRNQDPISPSERVKCPRDLETICLKCLRKDPRDRYASVQALVDDLRAYLEERSISARPMGTMEKSAKWVRRNTRAAVVMAAFVLTLVTGVAVSLYYADRANRSAKLANDKEADAIAASEREKVRAEEALREKNRADVSAMRSQRFSGYVLRSLGETDFWSRYFPLYIGSDGSIGPNGLRATPEHLRTLLAQAIRDFSEDHHELGKVLTTLANAMRSNNMFAECQTALTEAENAFKVAPETTGEDIQRLRFSRACYFHEVGELEHAYQAFKEILDQPQTIFSTTELADTKIRMAWLCADRCMIRDHTNDQLRKEWEKRANNELLAAMAIYAQETTPLSREKEAICKLLRIPRLPAEKQPLALVDGVISINKFPRGAFLLTVIGKIQEAELLRRQEKYAEAMQLVEEAELLVRENFGANSYMHLYAMGAVVGMEKLTVEYSSDVALKAKSLKSAIRRCREIETIGKSLVPKHAFFGRGYVILAQLYTADGQTQEAIRCLREAQTFVKMHPIDLGHLGPQIEVQLAKLAK